MSLGASNTFRPTRKLGSDTIQDVSNCAPGHTLQPWLDKISASLASLSFTFKLSVTGLPKEKLSQWFCSRVQSPSSMDSSSAKADSSVRRNKCSALRAEAADDALITLRLPSLRDVRASRPCAAASATATFELRRPWIRKGSSGELSSDRSPPSKSSWTTFRIASSDILYRFRRGADTAGFQDLMPVDLMDLAGLVTWGRHTSQHALLAACPWPAILISGQEDDSTNTRNMQHSKILVQRYCCHHCHCSPSSAPPQMPPPFLRLQSRAVASIFCAWPAGRPSSSDRTATWKTKPHLHRHASGSALQLLGRNGKLESVDHWHLPSMTPSGGAGLAVWLTSFLLYVVCAASTFGGLIFVVCVSFGP